MSDTVVSDIFSKIAALEHVLKCGDCKDFVDELIVIGRCGHEFCSKCIDKHRGKTCPCCKIPVGIKDAYEDKQLCHLVPLVKQLKNVLMKIESDYNHNDNVEKKENIVVEETPLRAQHLVKEAGIIFNSNMLCDKKATSNRENSPNSPISVLRQVENIGMVTPKNKGMSKKKAFTSPVVRSVKRTPLRANSLSASKHLANKSSPRLRKNISPKVLMSSQEKLEKKNIKGETKLHVAVISGDIDRVTKLFGKKANPNVKDNAGWTPLHEACSRNYLEIAKLLIDHGAEINVPGPGNITSLHDALSNGHLELACYLASNGADINTRTAEGKTSLDLCITEEAKKAIQEAFKNPIKRHKKVVPDKIKQIQETSTKTSNNLVFLPTSLTEVQKESVQKFASITNAEVVSEFSNEVTHIVTVLDEDGQCNRTLKVLQALLTGKWIVSFQWIEVCLEYKVKVPEEGFEVPGTKQQPNSNGPKRARENAVNQYPPLFDGCYFYIYGSFHPPLPPKEDIVDLIQMGGGKLLLREPKPDTVSDVHSTPYHAVGGPLADFSHFILYQDKPPRQNQIQKEHICTVSVQWFINSICAFTFLDVK